MIFFKEKTVTLGRCSADMQEWLTGEITKWLDDQWPFVIKRTDAMINFHDDSSMFQHRFSINPMKNVRYGEIHFLPQGNEVEIVATLKPSGVNMMNFIFMPIFLILFIAISLRIGIDRFLWEGLAVIAIVTIVLFFPNGPDEYLQRHVQKIIAKKTQACRI